MLLVPLRRVSTGEQVDGTGLRRQSDAFAAYAQQRGWDLHPRTYSDEGVSGFSGANLDGDLGRFLRDLKAGRSHRSDVALGVEDLDRLSRQSVRSNPMELHELLFWMNGTQLDRPEGRSVGVELLRRRGAHARCASRQASDGMGV